MRYVRQWEWFALKYQIKFTEIRQHTYITRFLGLNEGGCGPFAVMIGFEYPNVYKAVYGMAELLV
jgi:hypothetical protein